MLSAKLKKSPYPDRASWSLFQKDINPLQAGV